MKRTISLGIIGLALLVVMGTLVVGIYNAATGRYMLHAGGTGSHRGWEVVGNTERGQGQGRRRAESVSQNKGRQDADSTENSNDQGQQEPVNDAIRAESGDWLAYEGVLSDLVPEPVLQTADGNSIQLGMGPSSYRAGLDLELNAGDRVAATGFYEDDEFKVGELTNLTTGQSAVFRDGTGRPMWARQGRRRSG